MTRLRTGNRRRLKRARNGRIVCPKHGRPVHGDGWATPTVARFRCPVPTCKHVRYWSENSGLITELPA